LKEVRQFASCAPDTEKIGTNRMLPMYMLASFIVPFGSGFCCCLLSCRKLKQKHLKKEMCLCFHMNIELGTTRVIFKMEKGFPMTSHLCYL
jgi:hypothetical protein